MKVDLVYQSGIIERYNALPARGINRGGVKPIGYIIIEEPVGFPMNVVLGQLNDIVGEPDKPPVNRLQNTVGSRIIYTGDPPEPEIRNDKKTVKPPVGLRPVSVAQKECKRKRIVEITSAIERYIEAGSLIPIEWPREIDRLIEDV